MLLSKPKVLASVIALTFFSTIATFTVASDYTHITGPQMAFALAKDASNPNDPNRYDKAVKAYDYLSALTPSCDPQVSWHLGSLYAEGLGAPSDYKKALFHIRHAAAHGEPAAAFWLSRYYADVHHAVKPKWHFRTLDKQDADEAYNLHLAYLAKASLAGHVMAMDELAAKLASSNTEASQFWKDTANKHRGRIFPVQNAPESIASLALIAGEHHAIASSHVAQSPVAEIEPEQPSLVPTNQAPQAANIKQPNDALLQTQIQLVEAELKISSLEQELAKHNKRAGQLPNPYQVLADHGAIQTSTPADRLNHLGLDFFQGKNFVMAAQTFQRAHDLGSASAAANLGLMYLHGTGVEKDPREGLRLLRIAAKGGNVTAAENLALIYMQGTLGKKDIRRAKKWWEVASHHGSELATAYLSQM